MGDMNNIKRAAHFTSSMAYKLIPMGKRKMTVDELNIYKEANPKSYVKTMLCPLLFAEIGLTYIEEKQIEKRMQSCIDGGAHTQSLAWGNFMELVVYSILGTQYQISSKETTLHPKYGKFWSGSKDLFTVNAKTGEMESVAEIKCYQKKNFALYTDCLLQKDIELLKKDFPKEYWQIVSNAILEDVDIGEAITYMPYVSEHEEIKQMAEDYDGADAWKYKFIWDRDSSDLPFLPDGGYYKNINKFSFIIPQEDKELLTERMLQANELLN